MHQHVRTYDYLVRARVKIFDAVRPLSVDQYTQQFPIGAGSLRAILHHCLLAEWYYVARLTDADLPPYDRWPIRDEDPFDFPTLESTWDEQASLTRGALESVKDWDAKLSYVVDNDDGKRLAITCTYHDIATQLALHECYHRAQIANILRHLGVDAGELDYNAMTYTITELAD